MADHRSRFRSVRPGRNSRPSTGPQLLLLLDALGVTAQRRAAMVLGQGEVPGYAAAYAGEFRCRYGEAL
ncbi:hypothetical protein HMPREF1979_00982 [Actinomyces johnsonii F0542]|uniref:Uncharacterized protein n=1 Tax=Actinomyces johnsonii F0542 TaxID=1321818 RepID=U1S2L9_9ACTO|nr:hypothetical protein HMPREF1979_00982 [Actinomyces johnsonii F0542]